MTPFATRHVILLTIITLSLTGFDFSRKVESLGINYGQLGNNLPQPNQVLQLLQSVKVTKARIYDTNPQILTAFANSNIELIVTIENNMLAVLINPQQALHWVITHIKPYVPATKITGIAVGNEVYTRDDVALISNLMPAINSIHGVLAQLGLDQDIHVSTPFSFDIMANTYPPSSGSFQPKIIEIMTQFLHFLSTTKSPFWINAYPLFAYKDNPSSILLDYVLLNPNEGLDDPSSKLHYDNMLYAQVDSVIFAMSKLGFEDIEVRVSESGWPSMGDPNEVGASIQNAAIYNGNLVKRQMANEGTPRRPQMGLDVYLFSLFNENMKPGPTPEKNYGLYRPDMSKVYDVGLPNDPSDPSSTQWISSSSDAFHLVPKMGHRSLVYGILIYLVAFQEVFM